MKKLLIFSILFLTCSLGLKSVKAEYCNDGEMIEIPNIFDTEMHNFYKDYGNYGLSFLDYKERYTQSYNDLMSYIKANYKYYFFSATGVFMWNEEGLAVYIVAYSLQETNANYINFTISYTDTEKGQLTDNKAKFYKYSSLKNGFDQTKNSQFYGNFNDWYPIVRYGSSGTSPFKNLSGCNGEIQSNYYYSAGLDTNADVIIASESYGRKIIANQTERFYKKIKMGDKVYDDGDYLNRAVNKSNPKITFKFLTDTGQEDGHKIGVTATVDFQTGGKDPRYSYLLSFDGGNTWDGLTPRMTSDKYVFSKLENFEVIAQLYDRETEKSYYSTGLVDNIEQGYYSRWIGFERDTQYDTYTNIDGKEYLTFTSIIFYQVFNHLNGYPLQLYYSYDAEKWITVPKMQAAIYNFRENKTVYFMYRDVANQVVFRSTYTIDFFKETEALGEKINFSQECNTYSCKVNADFINYKDSHSYWVKSEQEQYKEIDINKIRGRYSWVTEDIKTFCAKITEKEQPTKIIQEKCFVSSGGSSSYDKSFKDILSSYSESIPQIMNVISNFFTSLPNEIQNMFVTILLIILAVFIIKLLL